uniref:Uncharacterized protein n=1 Tax=Rhipicephalus microplus TaxID=6941 RepID=A0A6G5ACC2_RHIMP
MLQRKKFLEFFFRRLQYNDTGKYTAEFPFISPCGREMNFVRCDDLPFVFTHIVQLPEESKEPGSKGFLLHNYAGNLLKVEFTPQHLCMPAGTGRVYHPAPERAGGVGLIRSLLAIELSKHLLLLMTVISLHLLTLTGMALATSYQIFSCLSSIRCLVGMEQNNECDYKISCTA